MRKHSRAEIFRPHGSMNAYISGSVLIAEVSGSWNIQMHQKSSNQSRPLVEQLEAAGRPWGVVTVLTDSAVSSLEVFEAGRKSVEEMEGTTKLVALAWVIPPDVEGAKVLRYRYEAMYNGLLESGVFESFDPAIQFVESVIEGRKQ
jgi:hypothetical protein